MQFSDSAAYERFMGRWSRAVAPPFLGWLAAPRGAAWLDVGCGTGIVAQTVIDLCAPSRVHAIDPSAAQVAAASEACADGGVAFGVADACSLPFASATFDIVASGLVLNFIADRKGAMREMRRVTRSGGTLAAYVWDFAEELSPSGPLRRTMRRLGAQVPAIPGTEASRLEALLALFRHDGLESIETKTIDVCLAYTDFDDFWQAQTPAYAPTTGIIAAMKDGERSRLMRALRESLPTGNNGVIEYFARANAVKARVPRYS